MCKRNFELHTVGRLFLVIKHKFTYLFRLQDPIQDSRTSLKDKCKNHTTPCNLCNFIPHYLNSWKISYSLYIFNYKQNRRQYWTKLYIKNNSIGIRECSKELIRFVCRLFTDRSLRPHTDTLSSVERPLTLVNVTTVMRRDGLTRLSRSVFNSISKN